MMNIKTLAVATLSTILLTACDDSTETIGNSLRETTSHFKIVTDTFDIASMQSIKVDSVLSNSQYSYLGRIKDYETESYVTCNYATQFNILEAISSKMLPAEELIVNHDSTHQVIADSCFMRIYFQESIGDTLNAMRLTAYELATPFDEGKFYYSNFNPEKAGLLRNDANAFSLTKMYTPLDLNRTDSARAKIVDKTNLQVIDIPMNGRYVKDNVEYNNYGTYLMRKYYENPEYFANSYNFSHQVCPGFFIKSTDGIGVMSKVFATDIVFYYRHLENNTEKTSSQLFTGTEEVLQTTTIENDGKTTQDLLDDHSCTYLKTPAGIFTEVTLPIDSIMYQHENDTLSSAKIVFTRYEQRSAQSYIPVTTSLLLLPKDSLTSFFENKNLPDSRTSYIAVYSSQYGTYTFNNISTLVTRMYANKAQGSENWNKIVLVPVDISYNTSSTTASITSVSNKMSLTSTRLIGGLANPYSPVRISVIYNKFE